MKDRDGSREDDVAHEDVRRLVEARMARDVETLLFGGRPLHASFGLRAVAFLGKDERRPEPSSEGEYVVGAGEREAIIAAFREVFHEDGRLVPTERDDGYFVSGKVCVQAPSATKAWNGAAGSLYRLLQQSGAVRDVKEAFKALDFLYLEVVEEGFEDLAAQAFSDKVSEGA